MAARPAPRSYSRAELRAGCARGSCLVLVGRRLYDLTAFARLHPGGRQALLQRAGTDVSALLDGPPHRHSENARRWLQQYYLGDLEPDGDARQTYLKTPCSTGLEASGPIMPEDPRYQSLDADEDLVDWRKPLLWQVGHLGEKYNEWVHQPVDRPIRLFHSNLMETLSRASWYVVCIYWLLVILLLSWYCYTALGQGNTYLFSSFTSAYTIPIHKYWFPLLFFSGIFIWSLTEYLIHRFIFHMNPPANSYYLITFHFLVHGLHHKSPFDSSRLVFPVMPASLVASVFYFVARVALPGVLGVSLLCGGLCGYLIYDMMHYYFHFGSPKEGTYLYGLKTYHSRHHFEHQKAGFGISSRFWDRSFQTLIPEETTKEN